MRKITIIILTLVSFLFHSNNIYSNYAQDDIDLICSAKWHIEYMMVSREKIGLLPKMKENSWIIYYSDGRA